VGLSHYGAIRLLLGQVANLPTSCRCIAYTLDLWGRQFAGEPAVSGLEERQRT